MAALPYNDRVEAFCRRLTDRRIDGSLAAAKGTAELLRQLVTSSRLNTPESLLAEVKRVGLRMQAAKPIGACRHATSSPGILPGRPSAACRSSSGPSAPALFLTLTLLPAPSSACLPACLPACLQSW